MPEKQVVWRTEEPTWDEVSTVSDTLENAFCLCGKVADVWCFTCDTAYCVAWCFYNKHKRICGKDPFRFIPKIIRGGTDG